MSLLKLVWVWLAEGKSARAFVARRGTESETTRAHRLTLIREVCRFLALDDPRTFVPAARFLGVLTTCVGPRTVAAGFHATTLAEHEPINSPRTAAGAAWA